MRTIGLDPAMTSEAKRTISEATFRSWLVL
jgi:hypothetical protein